MAAVVVVQSFVDSGLVRPFRRFCGFSSSDATPERTAFVRFRKELLARDLDEALFEAITRQLKAKAVTMKTGTLIDATVIVSASREDSEAGWAAHRKRKAVPGFKAHLGADADTAIVEELSVTPGNVHAGRAGHGALPDDPGAVYADSGQRRQAFVSAVQAKGGFPRVVQTSLWGVMGTMPCKI